MKRVMIVRGLPGSGKSRWAEKYILDSPSSAVICSADSFFNKRESVGQLDGKPMYFSEYKFDPTKLSIAHSECFKGFLNAIMEGCETIVVDNTNIRRWEYQNYELAARVGGYVVDIIEFRATTIDEVKVCIGRNTHNVPSNIIAQMAIDFEIDTRAIVKPIVAQ